MTGGEKLYSVTFARVSSTRTTPGSGNVHLAQVGLHALRPVLPASYGVRLFFHPFLSPSFYIFLIAKTEIAWKSIRVETLDAPIRY